MVRFALLWICLGLFVSCVKDKPNHVQTEKPNLNHSGVWVLNEGVYGNSNADLSFIDLSDNTVYNNLYKQHYGESFGDIAQDVQWIQQTLWVTVNNSHKIIILDPNTFQPIHEIKNIISPRYMQSIGDSVVLVTSLTTNHIYCIRTSTYEVFKVIDVNYPGTEHLVLHNNYVYVTNWHENSPLLYRIHVPDFNLASSIILNHKASHDIVVDADDNIWVLSGNPYKNVSSHLQVLHAQTYQTIKDLAFPNAAEPIRLCCDMERKNLYFIGVNYSGQTTYNGLFKMNYLDDVLPQQPFIPANMNSYFYSVAINPTNNFIFLADANGFNQRSTLYEFSGNGKLQHTFITGLGSTKMLFQ